MRRDICRGSSRPTRRFRCLRSPRRSFCPARSVAAWLADGLILATCLVYFIYTPFDEWSYLRFLLPAIALMLVLACAVTVRLLDFAPAVSAGPPIVAVVTDRPRRLLCAHGQRSACVQSEILEQRYRSAGLVVRDRLPANAVVLAVWDSGAVRFHGRKDALTWEGSTRRGSIARSRGSRSTATRRSSCSIVGRAGIPQPVCEPQRDRQARLAAEVRDRSVGADLRSEGSRGLR